MDFEIDYDENASVDEDQFDDVLDFDLSDEVIDFLGEDQWDPMESYHRGSQRLTISDIPIEDLEKGTEDIAQRAFCFLSDLHKDLDEIHLHFPDTRVWGMEVGDDRVDVSFNRTIVELGIFFQEELLKMKTSAEDTFISKDFWNFCETTGVLPCGVEQSFNYVKKTNETENFGFIDFPILRILMDVSKTDRSHSSSSVGKASMLASRMSLVRTSYREVIQLSSLFQDALLNTPRSPDPKYLPKIMGGSGCPPLWGNAENLYLYVLAYKGGTYERVYATATRELMECVHHLDNGQPSEPVFCQRLRDRQDYLYGTYQEKVLIPPKYTPYEDGILHPQPIYLASGVTNLIQNVETRLVRANRLIGRKAMERKSEEISRIYSILSRSITVNEEKVLKFKASYEARLKYGLALNANSAFQRLLMKCASDRDVTALLKQEFSLITTGELYFNQQHANWLSNGARGRVSSINDLTTSEDMFVFEEVSVENSLRVPGIPLNSLYHLAKGKRAETVNRVGLYEISGTMEEWADRTLQRLLDIGRRPLRYQDISIVYQSDTQWVNDDTLIISDAIEKTRNFHKSFLIVLFSQDKKLGKQLSQSTNTYVYRIDPTDLIATFPNRIWNSEQKITVEELLLVDSRISSLIKEREPLIYIDYGSLESCATKITPLRYAPTNDIQLYKYLPVPQTSYREGGLRKSERIAIAIPPVRYPARQIFSPDKKPVPRKFYHGTSSGYQPDTISLMSEDVQLSRYGRIVHHKKYQNSRNGSSYNLSEI